MPAWLRGLESRTTVGPIRLVSDVFARCEAMLLQSQAQFVLSHAHPLFSSELQSQHYPFARIGSDVIVPVCAPDATGRPRHQLANASPSSPLPLLSYSPESGIGRILQEIHGAALERCPAHSVFQAHLASVLRTMALDGRGMAWLPQTLIAEDLACGRLMEAAPRDWHIELEIRLYRDRPPLGKAAEDFWAAVCAAST
jgi:DNA-binding transcriptional LysR family regulator